MLEVPTSNPAQNIVLCIRLEHRVAFYVVTITGFQTVAEKRLLASLYPSRPSVRTYQGGSYWTDSVKFGIDDFLLKKLSRSSKLGSSRITIPGIYTKT
jgi:hypothetical protein